MYSPTLSAVARTSLLVLTLCACDRAANADRPNAAHTADAGAAKLDAARIEAPPPRVRTTPGPRIIVFGGGWGPEGTQASIEAHVEMLTKALASRAPDVMFASGDGAVRDVQIDAKALDEAGELLGLVFDRRDNVGVDYRTSKLAERGGATKRALLDALTAARDDALGTIAFGAGHGTRASEDVMASLELWGPDDRLTVDELARHLDGHARRAPVALVLGQCHSGAFTDLLFEGADVKEGPVAEPIRCTFAAVPREREAAGCTPDLSDPDAHAYVAEIATALARPADADVDLDGKVSLAEAHAFARIRDRTVDVPVSTAELWIERALGAKVPKPADVKLPKLLPRARPTERAVIEALAPKGLGADAVVAAHDELERLDDVLEKLDVELADLEADRDLVRRRILDAVLLRWPELASPYHAVSRRLLAGDAKEVVDFIKAQRSLGELKERALSIHVKDEERLALEKKRARVERWVRAVMIVAREDALRRSKRIRDVAVLDRILACESLVP
ncbi:hypothetical protein L6R52_30760 [Myxococcota bacterium]|nr:hypothetical protein [Myxococcota bacterium]